MSATTEQVVVPPTERPTWTGRFRTRAVGSLPPDKLLPDRQPAYVASWIYVFGALTLAAFGVVLLSGAVLAVEGPSWWHTSNIGLYVNSTHLWGTELFFFFMVIHLWGKFFMAAWRGRRRATWITGVVSFVVSIGAAFTGYLSAELRLPVDKHPGQGRHQRHRRGSDLQRDQLRSDADVAHHAPAAGRGGPGRIARPARPPKGCGAAVRPDRSAVGLRDDRFTAG